MTKQYNVAVVGATGAVGEVLLEILAERNFPILKLYALASEKSIGREVKFGDDVVAVEDLALFDFSKVDFAFFSAGASVSKIYAPKATLAGAIVIDNTSEFRYKDNIPLIVPEVNMHALDEYEDFHLIANPNCSTIQMLVALAPLHRVFGITAINVSTYQAVSGSGKKAIDELALQSRKLLSGEPLLENDISAYSARIAFNALPHIDVWQDNGFTKEEMKMNWETKKILDPSIEVNATCVRIPAFFGHSESVHIITKEPIDPEEASGILAQAEGVRVMQDYPTLIDSASTDAVWVGRIRRSLTDGIYGLNLWIVADNIRKGAALNSIQIAEKIITNFMDSGR